MKKIVLTGGGTAGHVTPNIALMPELKNRGYDISYIGSYEGMEKGMIMETKTPYYGIATGKLRRYFDLKNFTDPFRIIKGYFEARSRLKKIHPDVVFSKGRICCRSCCPRCTCPEDSCDHSRIRHDTRPGQQTLYPCCLQSLL